MRFRTGRHARWLIGVLFVCLILPGCDSFGQYSSPYDREIGSVPLGDDPAHWHLDQWILSQDKKLIVVQYGYPSGTYRVYRTDTLEEIPFDEEVQEWMTLDTNLRWESPPYSGDRAPSPDGSLVARSRSEDCHPVYCYTVQIRDSHTNRLLYTLDVEVLTNNWPSPVAWSPDGENIAWASTFGDIWIWEAETGVLQQHWRVPNTEFTYIAWSPDSVHLATGDGDGTTTIWDTASGEALQHLNMQRDDNYDSVHSIVWLSGAKLLTIDYYSLILWDLNTGAHNSVRLTR
jgi:WD40 repeat protein